MTIQQDPGDTITATAGVGDMSEGELLAVFEDISHRRSTDPACQLELGETLGSGGMGTVKRATQVALAREVAVKTLRVHAMSSAAVLELLREAWVTGSLEHPNVVPVYDIGAASDGRPLIVLKRIEGVTWSSLMGDAEAVEKRFAASDLLEWNLRILLRVLDAVRFAHSRGIIHRDLKPDNVMIGAFGEVYVMDWGLAVSTRSDEGGRFRLASEANDMAGTPAYMAPELLGGAADEISPPTDVYLAGAMLYQIMAGRPPHVGASTMAIVSSIVESLPELPEDAPAELAAICRQAMAARPEDRFASAEALQRAVQEHLDRRGAIRMAAQAEHRLAELEVLLSAAGSRESESQQRIHKLFGACRFGFRAALVSWPENQDARRAWNRAALLMAEHELAADNPAAAEALLGELDGPPSELGPRIVRAREAISAKQARVAHLEKLGRDFDRSIGESWRVRVIIPLGVLWVAFPIVAALFFPPLAFTSHLELTILLAGSLGVLLALGYFARQAVRASRLNFRLYTSAVATFVAHTMLGLILSFSDIPAVHALPYRYLLWALAAAIVSVTLEWRMWPIAVAFFLGFLMVLHDPHLWSWSLFFTNLLVMLNVVYIWTPLAHKLRHPIGDRNRHRSQGKTGG